MRKVYLIRHTQSDQGTFGQLITQGFRCMTAELPYRSDKRNRSCIYPGLYVCEVVHSRRFGLVYTVKDVQNRSFIRMHSGNLAGDVTKGYIAHTAGCILLGKTLGKLGGQTAVLCSRPTVRRFSRLARGLPFELLIMQFYPFTEGEKS